MQKFRTRPGLLEGLIRLIYPPRCPACGRFLSETPRDAPSGGTPFCAQCAADFVPVPSPLCTRCGRPFAGGAGTDHPCGACIRKPPAFDTARAPYLYEGAVKRAVHRLKYGQQSQLAEPLAAGMARYARKALPRPENLLAVPVPLHPRRLRERGFNQSALLAKCLSRRVGATFDAGNLRRVRYTKPQAGLEKAERKRNVKNAFELRNTAVIRGLKILLVDDVLTTGHTLNECARVLKRAGAREVHGLVVARAAGY